MEGAERKRGDTQICVSPKVVNCGLSQLCDRTISVVVLEIGGIGKGV